MAEKEELIAELEAQLRHGSDDNETTIVNANERSGAEAVDKTQAMQKQLNDALDHASQLTGRLDVAIEKRNHAERVRDTLLSRYSSVPSNDNEQRRARSELIPREAVDQSTMGKDLKSQLSQALRQNEELRALITELQSSPTGPRSLSTIAAEKREISSPRRGGRQSEAMGEGNDENYWPKQRDMLAARERLIVDYKQKLHRVLKEKASLETNFTAKYMQELASAKAELVDQHKATIAQQNGDRGSRESRGQASAGSKDDMEIPNVVALRLNNRLSQQHLESIERIESRLATEHEHRAADRNQLGSNRNSEDDETGADEPFRGLVAEYDRRIVALLATDRGGILVDDLSIKPEQFEAMAQDYGRRSLDVERPSARQRRQVSYDARYETPPERHRRHQSYDVQRDSRMPSYRGKADTSQTKLPQGTQGTRTPRTTTSNAVSGSTSPRVLSSRVLRYDESTTTPRSRDAVSPPPGSTPDRSRAAERVAID